jgi:hypothetical protein
LLPIVAVLAACGPAAESIGPPAATPTPRGIDLSAWDVSTIGTGPAAMEANGGVDLFIPATARGDPQQANLIAVALKARCKLSGDFDLQIDYTLTTWPPRNGIRFGLVAGSDTVLRTSNPVSSDNTYSTTLSGHLFAVDTTDKNGRLRLTRAGTTVSGYYLTNGNWVSIASAPAAAGAPAYTIQAWAETGNFGGHDVRVNLKNLKTTGCN